MMDQFLIRDKASEGKKIFLSDPGTGKLTDEWLIIRSCWSDEFQKAKADAVQQAFIDSKEPEEKRAKDEDRKARLIASLVAGWSFDQEYTPENVIDFIKQAPQIADQIDKVSTRDHFFFGKASSRSSSGAKKK